MPEGLSNRISSAYGIHDFGSNERIPLLGILYVGDVQDLVAGEAVSF